MSLQSWFLILGDNLEKHACELCCCTKCTLPGLWGGEVSFPSVGRELLYVVLETSLSSWRSTARQSKRRGPGWERLGCSAIPKRRRTGAFPREMAVLEQHEALGATTDVMCSTWCPLLKLWAVHAILVLHVLPRISFGARKLERDVRTKHCRKTWAKAGS